MRRRAALGWHVAALMRLETLPPLSELLDGNAGDAAADDHQTQLAHKLSVLSAIVAQKEGRG